LTLIFDKNTTNCVQTFHVPPSLRPHCSKLSAVGHPRAGTKLHPGKGILNQADVSQTTGKTLSQVPTQTNSLQSLIPHMPVPPQEMCPFSSQQSFGCPISFLGLQQQARQEVSEPCSCSLAPSGKQFPTILSPRENFSRA
jgi:hypothetical protein